jgi:L-amino acid N-acyltransferase YncA
MSRSTFRLANAEDFRAIAAITNHYIRTTAIHFGYDEVPANELCDLWQSHEDLYPWLVADRAGEVLAYAKAGVYRARTAYRWTTETSIYVAAAECGRGQGPILYERLCEVLRAQGFHTAIGGIALPNDASVRMHERLGFAPCGTIRRAGRKFDRWHDVGFWQLDLQAHDQVPGVIGTPHAAFAATAPR